MREQLASSFVAAHEQIQNTNNVDTLRSVALQCLRPSQATWRQWLPSALTVITLFAAVGFLASALWTKEAQKRGTDNGITNVL
jgi:hypothetical protein